VNREAQGVLLFLVGGALLWASLTDLYLRYVRAGLRPMLILAGVVLIIAAIATLWSELRPARAARRDRAGADHGGADHGGADHGGADHGGADHGGADHGGADHGGGHREPRVSWLLVLPVLALILVAPPALGSFAADRTGTVLQEPPILPPLPAGDPLRMTVVDYAGRAAFDHGRSLGGRRVEIVGFVAAGRRGPYLIRMVFNCCAADAQPIKVGLAGRVPPGLRPDTWLDIIGTYTSEQIRDEVNGGPIPFIDVSQSRQVPPPKEPYEF
jgi:uncharacterized repeat protein (TIGR03943 family)